MFRREDMQWVLTGGKEGKPPVYRSYPFSGAGFYVSRSAWNDPQALWSIVDWGGFLGHCHDDMGCAVANSLIAIEAGCDHLQGTFLGYGERCGNANLSALIPSLQLKRGYRCVPDSSMKKLTKTAGYIADISNIPLGSSLPYVGNNAFSHKGGMHIDGVKKNPASFEHVNPSHVGNERSTLLSEVAGRTALLDKIREIDSDIDRDSPEARHLLDSLKEMEFEGYQFESAGASFEILTLKELGKYQPHFESLLFRIIGERLYGSPMHLSSAIVKVGVGDKEKISVAEGNGPVHAMDQALREALEGFYPSLSQMKLTDYKVRVMDPGSATAAKVRVLIESTDGSMTWTTVGVSSDIIEASYKALVDSIEYKLYKDNLQLQ
jgi:2-isopropylmalate synthase